MMRSMFFLLSIFLGVANVAFAAGEIPGCVWDTDKANIRLMADLEVGINIPKTQYMRTGSQIVCGNQLRGYCSQKRVIRELILDEWPTKLNKEYGSELFIKNYRERMFLSLYNKYEYEKPIKFNKQKLVRLECPSGIDCVSQVLNKDQKCYTSVTIRSAKGQCFTYTLVIDNPSWLRHNFLSPNKLQPYLVRSKC